MRHPRVVEDRIRKVMLVKLLWRRSKEYLEDFLGNNKLEKKDWCIFLYYMKEILKVRYWRSVTYEEFNEIIKTDINRSRQTMLFYENDDSNLLAYIDQWKTLLVRTIVYTKITLILEAAEVALLFNSRKLALTSQHIMGAPLKRWLKHIDERYNCKLEHLIDRHRPRVPSQVMPPGFLNSITICCGTIKRAYSNENFCYSQLLKKTERSYARYLTEPFKRAFVNLCCSVMNYLDSADIKNFFQSCRANGLVRQLLVCFPSFMASKMVRHMTSNPQFTQDCELFVEEFHRVYSRLHNLVTECYRSNRRVLHILDWKVMGLLHSHHIYTGSGPMRTVPPRFNFVYKSIHLLSEYCGKFLSRNERNCSMSFEEIKAKLDKAWNFIRLLKNIRDFVCHYTYQFEMRQKNGMVHNLRAEHYLVQKLKRHPLIQMFIQHRERPKNTRGSDTCQK